MVINIDIGHYNMVRVDILGNCGIYTTITSLPQECCIIVIILYSSMSVVKMAFYIRIYR